MYLECSLIGNELHFHNYYANTHLFKKFIAKFIERMVVLESNEIKKCEIDSSGGLLNVNGNNLLNCSDILTSQNNYGKVTSSMSTYFNSIIENAYSSSIPSTFPGRYQGNCKPSGSQPKGHSGLNEQGVHHVAMGWYSNKATLYVDTCVESTGQSTSKTFDIMF